MPDMTPTRDRVEQLFNAKYTHPAGLAGWVANRRDAGETWMGIAMQLHNGGIKVSHETLRTWYGKEPQS